MRLNGQTVIVRLKNATLIWLDFKLQTLRLCWVIVQLPMVANEYRRAWVRVGSDMSSLVDLRLVLFVWQWQGIHLSGWTRTWEETVESADLIFHRWLPRENKWVERKTINLNTMNFLASKNKIVAKNISDKKLSFPFPFFKKTLWLYLN